jgi:myo-inositol-1-phosphate synthase
MANGLTKEIEHEKGRLKASASVKKSAPGLDNLFHDGAQASQKDRSRIQLPDVTGITNAIESPAKLTAEYYAYRAEKRLRETESKSFKNSRHIITHHVTDRLLKTLNIVHNKIQQLEEENGISRRRVRELEMELEDCKRDVIRERTRLIEQEENLKRQQAALKTVKGKARARDFSADTSQLHERYKEVVEEKKGRCCMTYTAALHAEGTDSIGDSH